MNFLSCQTPRVQSVSLSLLTNGFHVDLSSVVSPLCTLPPSILRYVTIEVTRLVQTDLSQFHDESANYLKGLKIPSNSMVQYIVMKDKDWISKCLSSFQPTSNKTHPEIHHIDAILVCVIFVGVGQFLASECKAVNRRLDSFVQEVWGLKTCIDLETSKQQRVQLLSMMFSCLVDDNSITTNEQFESMYSQVDDAEAEMMQHITTRSLPKRKRFSLAERRRKNEMESIDQTPQSADSTALVSSNATSADISKVLSEQMQGLSLAETGMKLVLYHEKHSKQLGNSKDRTAVVGKSPVRVLNRNIGKDRYSTQSEMFGFFVSERKSTYESSDNTTITTASVSTGTTLSSGFLPKLCGPNRDRVSSKRQSLVRKNKLALNSQTSHMHTTFMQNNFNPFKDVMEDSGSRNTNDHASSNGALEKPSLAKEFTPSLADVKEHKVFPGMFSPPIQIQHGNLNKITPVRNLRSEYVPGSRKIFTLLALNEDFSCSYRNSKMISSSIDGTVQVQLKSESTAFVPFSVLVKDNSGHILKLEENVDIVSDISNQLKKSDEWGYKFIVTIPKPDIYYPILKYKCTQKVAPIPLRVQSKVRHTSKKCRVALQISSNPSNPKKLNEFTIVMSVPEIVIGESVTTQPEGGVWSDTERNVVWQVKELGIGEKFQLQAQFVLTKDFTEESGKLSFPVMVRCHSMSAQLSDIHFLCSDVPKSFPADVTMTFASRFRILQREVEY